MPKIIAIHSFRGGTGKSNTTANLASLVALSGKRVGIIDTDIQSPGIHVIFGFNQSKLKYALNDYLWGKCKIEDAAYDLTQAIFLDLPSESSTKIWLIPSSVKTGEIAKILREGYDVGKLNDGFQQVIKELQLDYLFIDTHPGVNEETLLSIAISDRFLLIMRPDSQDFQGTAVTVELAHRLEVQQIMLVINKIPQGMDHQLLQAQVESTYRADVIGMIPLNSELASLASSGLFILKYPQHPITQELRKIAQQLMA